MFIIAAVVIGREAHRLDAMSPRVVFDLDEAVLSVSERLPIEVTSELSYADVRDLLRWHMADLRAQGLKPPAAMEEPQDPSKLIVVDEDASVSSLVARVASEGRSYRREDVEAVVEAHFAYLREIGAVGPPAGDAQL
ncbi:MAG TPA: hypothetical protein VMK16_06690 [Acidimicrobiales bacterium]|nr:hypothetical protein [Acidimicrobiales bacterium]